MSRRTPLVLVGLAALLAGCELGTQPTCRDAAVEPELATMAERHSIRVVAADGPLRVRSLTGTLRADRAEPESVTAYAPMLAREFDLYPPELVRRVGLRWIVLCRNLSYASTPVEALPHFETDALYLDVTALTALPDYNRTTIHHEFFHFLDYRDDGRLDRDPTWEALNPPGVRYGHGGWAARRDPEAGVDTDRYPGFLNSYSKSAVEEDKAVVFAYLVARPSYLAGRTTADPILRAKVDRMKELLVAFCPEIDESFWEKARLAERTAANELPIPEVPGPGGWRRPPGGR